MEKYGKLRAGFIPYIFENSEPVFMFMTPSDPRFGGPDPSIAKGHVEIRNGQLRETLIQAAIREAEEELGLRFKNILHNTVQRIWEGNKGSIINSYKLVVFIGEVRSKTDFGVPHFETGSTSWLTEKEFQQCGKIAHKDIVACARKKILMLPDNK